MRGGSTGGRSGAAGSRRGGCRLRPRRCREPGRRRGTQARRGHGEPPRRRAGDEGRRAWAPARHCSLQQGAGEAVRCPGASGPEGRRARAPLQGAGIWARASGARRLGAQPVGTTRTVGRTDEVAAARVVSSWADVYSHYGPGRGMASATPRHTGPSATGIAHPPGVEMRVEDLNTSNHFVPVISSDSISEKLVSTVTKLLIQI